MAGNCRESEAALWNVGAASVPPSPALQILLAGAGDYAQVCECITDMGDKSPKTKNKQAAQKQAKAAAAARQKNDNKAASQVVKPKR